MDVERGRRGESEERGKENVTIVVAMKIVTSLLANRISTAMEANNLLVEEQSGFHRHEEAVTQFVALAEIVRR